jgi:tRNA pseudouridine38-40 synthase
VTDASDRAVLLTVAYDGAGYAGWAPQPGARTVAGEVLDAVRHIDPSVERLRAASRTDAGVHARCQRAAFDTAMTVPARGWVLGLGRHLPPAVAVKHAAFAAAGFDPRREATGKRYRYTLLCEPVRDPFLAARAWRVGPLGDDALARLRAELEQAVGTHDFAAFASSRDEREHTVRTLTAVAVTRIASSPALVAIDVSGDGFLHRMVRILVGTTVDVARNRRPVGSVSRALASKNRSDAGLTAPPDGLCLEEVHLRSSGTDGWPPETGKA